MLAKFRSYRVLTRILALSVTMASLLPFIEHACAMMSGDMNMHRKCCCVKQADDQHAVHGHDMHQPMVQHKGHHDMPVHEASHHHMPAADHMPATDEAHHHQTTAADEGPCEHQQKDLPVSDDCCVWESETNASDDYLQSRFSKKWIVDIVLTAELTPVLTEVPVPFRPKPPDPPHSSLPALHVMFASFLT